MRDDNETCLVCGARIEARDERPPMPDRSIDWVAWCPECSDETGPHGFGPDCETAKASLRNEQRRKLNELLADDAIDLLGPVNLLHAFEACLAGPLGPGWYVQTAPDLRVVRDDEAARFPDDAEAVSHVITALSRADRWRGGAVIRSRSALVTDLDWLRMALDGSAL